MLYCLGGQPFTRYGAAQLAPHDWAGNADGRGTKVRAAKAFLTRMVVLSGVRRKASGTARTVGCGTSRAVPDLLLIDPAR